MMSSYYDHIRNIRKKYLKYFDVNSVVLDIGCGDGVLMKYLIEEGYSAMGIDTDINSVAHCREKKLTVFPKDAISFLQEKKSSFGGIICSHLIEHIPLDQILPLIKGCYEALIEGGVLLVITPNINNLGGSANFWNDPSDIRPFTNDSLRKLFAKTEFTIINIGYDKDTKVNIRNDLIHFPLDLFRQLFSVFIYGSAGLYTEVFALAKKG